MSSLSPLPVNAPPALAAPFERRRPNDLAAQVALPGDGRSIRPHPGKVKSPAEASSFFNNLVTWHSYHYFIT
jgi:hypothetical protein